MKTQFTYSRHGGMFKADGDGWTYFGFVGHASQFESTKKIPSIRAIKTLVKELNKV